MVQKDNSEFFQTINNSYFWTNDNSQGLFRNLEKIKKKINIYENNHSVAELGQDRI